MKRVALVAVATVSAAPAFAHHPNFSWGMIGEHLLEWDHLAFILATLAVAALGYRVVSNRSRRRTEARVTAKPERRHDPR